MSRKWNQEYMLSKAASVRLVFILIIVLCVFMLTGCLPAAAPPSAPQPTAESDGVAGVEPTPIVENAPPSSPEDQPATNPFSGRLSFMVFGEPAELEAYRALLAGFNTQYPNVKVELIHIPSQSDYLSRLVTQFAAGDPPDVMLLNYRRVAAFAAKGSLEPLGPYLAQSQLIHESDFYSQALEAFRWQGQLSCLPQNISSLVVYYNKDLFDLAGTAYPRFDWTWDDFLKTAQALTQDQDGDGKTDQYGLGVEPSFLRLAPFIWQNGGDVVNNYAAPNRLELYTVPGMQAFTFFVDLQAKYHVVPGAAEETAEKSESRFMNGRLGMYLNSRRVVPTFRTISGFDWDVAALPRQQQAASVLHADGYCLAAASHNKEAAWKFIEYANSVPGQTLIAGTGRTVPSLKAVADSPAFLDPNARPKNSRVFLEVIPTIRSLPLLPEWIEIEKIVDAELERAFYGQTSIIEAAIAAVDRAQPFFTPEQE
jgi:multiple sugar transport system substrate-binding protein